MKSHQRVLLPGSAGRQRVGRGNLPAPGCCKAAGCSTAENGGRRWGGLPAGIGVSSVSQIFSPRRLAELLLAASIYALFIETNVKTFYKYGRGLFRSCRCGVGTVFGQGLPSVPLPRLLVGRPWAAWVPPTTTMGPEHPPALWMLLGWPENPRGARPDGNLPRAGSVSQPGHCFLPAGEGFSQGRRRILHPPPPQPSCLPLPALHPWGKWAEPELNISNPKLSENSP